MTELQQLNGQIYTRQTVSVRVFLFKGHQVKFDSRHLGHDLQTADKTFLKKKGALETKTRNYLIKESSQDKKENT